MNSFDPFEALNRLKACIEERLFSLENSVSTDTKSRYRKIHKIINQSNELNIPISDEIRSEEANLVKMLDLPNEGKKELEVLKGEFTSLAIKIKHRLKNMHKKTTVYGPKALCKKLRVTFSDGTVFFEARATDTFIKVLQYIGLQRLSELEEITISGYPLISTQKNELGRQVHQVEGYFVEAHSSTEHKATLIRKIAIKLNIDLLIEVLDGGLSDAE